MKCRKCGGEVEIDFTKILTSLPEKYEAKCKDCGYITYLLCSECHSTEGLSTEEQWKCPGVNEPTHYYESNTPTQTYTPYENFKSPFYQQGWVCPKCGAVLAPSQAFCPFCSPAQDLKITCGTTPTAGVPDSMKFINITSSDSTRENKG